MGQFKILRKGLRPLESVIVLICSFKMQSKFAMFWLFLLMAYMAVVNSQSKTAVGLYCYDNMQLLAFM
jgi:hypothetical protein